MTCRVCGTIVEGNVINKLPHEFKDGLCIVCGEKEPISTPSIKPTEEPTPTTETSQPTQTPQPTKPKESGNTFWIILICCIVVLVIIIIITFIVKRRYNKI